MTTKSSATPLSTVSRADFRATRVLVLIAALLGVLATLVALWPSGPLSFTSSVQNPGPAYPAPGIAPGANAHYDDTVVWTIADPTMGQRLLAALPWLVVLAAVVVGAWCLWRLMDAVASGEPFSARSTRQVRLLALVLIAAGMLWPFARMISGFALVTQVQELPEVLFTFSLIEFWPVVAGFCLLVLTEVFARGARLREDVEGLV